MEHRLEVGNHGRKGARMLAAAKKEEKRVCSSSNDETTCSQTPAKHVCRNGKTKLQALGRSQTFLLWSC